MAQAWRVGGHGVKKNEYTEELIAFAVKQVALGTWSPGVCKLTIGDAMFYNWAHEGMDGRTHGTVSPEKPRRLWRDLSPV